MKMDVDPQEPTREDQKEGLTLEELLALRLRDMDERLRLEGPNLTPDQLYGIVSRFIGLLE